ncbi:CwfJ C-terminus 1-domain-containing protein-like protein [Mycena rosella]|uniref:CwfJ C-terminus 1-domain-containing protein-like protein n=1 Tax=Mycena rosella TaxID=1033263 RepID=A0AAD7H0D6_MYCRO|nr:CwfJ C-terminus 1-domain-containing protein-like protein [Mycena rosella]
MSVKVLTVGSAVGSIRDLFAKIKAIDAKHGKFDLVLCTGDFFGPLGESTAAKETEQLLAGTLEAPIECYIMQGDNPLSDAVIQKFAKTGGELCKNVFLLNKSGIITTANGLRIACLGGRYDPEIYASAEAPPGFSSPFFSTHTMERLLSNTLTTSTAKQSYKSLADIQSTASSSQLIDVLITNAWPASITNFSAAPLPVPELASIGAPPMDDTIRRTKPRYHFAAGGGQPPMFWEREPFLWDDEEGRVSRFVSLGAFGGEPTPGKKQRWFYAFSIAPNTPTARPANTTKNPFTTSFARPMKRPFESTAEGENFIFGNVRQPQKRTRMAEGDPGKPPPGYKCHRCEGEHFINDCPERTKPPEGYICKICDNVRASRSWYPVIAKLRFVQPGHLVRDCPTRFALGDTGGKKPKEGYICRACGSDAHFIDDCPASSGRPPQNDHRQRGGRRGPPKEIAPDECWFCLSNPNLAKHLIVAIGSECYVTLPKGQIIPTQSAADHVAVPGGGHVLIVPITHYPTFSTIPGDLAAPIIEETEKHKAALRAMYAKYGSAIVAFEVGRLSAKGGHAHVQAVPVPLNYFRVDLPDGRKMVHLMKDHVPFSIQFGRQVLVSLLDMPDRLDWKACTLAEDEDRADAQAFKAAFLAFDPTL